MFVSDKSQARAAAQVLSNIPTHACMVSRTVRGPESVLITGSPYKVIIQALQLVLHYVLVSIG